MLRSQLQPYQEIEYDSLTEVAPAHATLKLVLQECLQDSKISYLWQLLETAKTQFTEHLPSLVADLSGLEASPRYSAIDLLSCLTDEELEQPVQQIDGHIHAFEWDDYGETFAASDIPILYVARPTGAT